MKKILLLYAICLWYATWANDISGIYVVTSNNQESYIEIFKKNEQFYAVGFANKDNIDSGNDIKNPNPQLRNRPIRGIVFLWGLRAKNNKEYYGGKIYNFSNGMQYYANMEQNGNILKVRVSKDSKGLFGKTLKWRKATHEEVSHIESKRLDINTLELPQ